MTARTLLGRISRRGWLGGVSAAAVVTAVASHRTWLPVVSAPLPSSKERSALDDVLSELATIPGVELEVAAEAGDSTSTRLIVTLENDSDGWIAVAKRAVLTTYAWGDALILANANQPIVREASDRRGPQPPRSSIQTLLGPGQRIVEKIPVPERMRLNLLGTTTNSEADLTRVLYIVDVAELPDLGLVEMGEDGRIYPIYGAMRTRRLGRWLPLPSVVAPDDQRRDVGPDEVEAPPAPPMTMAKVPYRTKLKAERKHRAGAE